MSNHNHTPVQLSTPEPIRRRAYNCFPETCEALRGILDEVTQQVMQEFELLPEDEVTVDIIVSQAFCSIRDTITQPFRDEQMKLLYKLDRERKVREQ